MLRRSAGAALAEALVSLALLLAGLAGSLALLLQTLQDGREAAHRRGALRIASAVAEELRLQRPPLAPERAAELARLAWQEAAGAALPDGVTLTVEIEDASLPSYAVILAWPAAGGGWQRLRLPVRA